MIGLPMWDELSLMRAESAQISDNLAQLNEITTLRDQLLSTFNSISKDDLAKLSEFLPEKPNTEDLLVSMESQVRERGIQLKNVNFVLPQVNLVQDPTAPPPPLVPSTVTYNFAVSTGYEGFRSLIEAFEKNLRLVDISDIAFVSGEDSGIYNYTLKARSYYQK